MKRLLALLLALGLLGSVTPVFAEETGVPAAPDGGGDVTVMEPAQLPAWAMPELADGYALGLFGDEITTTASKEEGEGDNKTTVYNAPAGYAVEAAATTATSVLVKLLG